MLLSKKERHRGSMRLTGREIDGPERPSRRKKLAFKKGESMRPENLARRFLRKGRL